MTDLHPTNENQTPTPKYKVLLVGGPDDGRILEVGKVEERYYLPVLDEFENMKVHDDISGDDCGCDLNTFRTSMYNTVTIPGMSGRQWFIGIYQGMNMDDVIDNLYRRYIR